MKSALQLTIALLLGTACLAGAAETTGSTGGERKGRGNREEMMKLMDTDGNGVISDAEKKAGRLKRLDKDGDGVLSAEEEAAGKGRRGQGGERGGKGRKNTTETTAPVAD